jgi:cyclic pyranopterin phosphate synthase
MELSHVDSNGKATMVDVGGKDITVRTATARACIKMNAETLERIKDNTIKKGDVLACARIAGITAAKKTSELIPLCHNIPIDIVTVEFEFSENGNLVINSYARCEYKTGIEMEALTAVSVAALTVYDMCKAVDRSMTIQNIMLTSKSGGRSGDFFQK